MKIGVLGLTFIPHFSGRGVFRVTSSLLSTVKRLYPDIDFYILSDTPLSDDFVNCYTTISCDPNKVKEYNLDYLICPSGWWWCRGDSRDWTWTPTTNNIVKYKKALPNTKLVTIVHDIIHMLMSDTGDELVISPTPKNKHYKKFIQEIIDNTDIILTISEYTKQDMTKYLDTRNKDIYVMYPSVMLPNVQLSNQKLSFSPFFLYNGGYDYRKGLSHILDNFIQLKLRDKLKSNLVLTGYSKFLNKNTNFLINYGREKGWVIEKGYVNDEELSVLLSNAVASLYPSLYEGFGLPPLESMYLSCPVIVADNSSIPEVCGDAAYYLKNRDDEDEFQKAFIRLENDEILRNKLIEKGKENIKRFSWEKSAHLFVNILKKNMINK